MNWKNTVIMLYLYMVAMMKKSRGTSCMLPLWIFQFLHQWIRLSFHIREALLCFALQDNLTFLLSAQRSSDSHIDKTTAHGLFRTPLFHFHTVFCSLCATQSTQSVFHLSAICTLSFNISNGAILMITIDKCDNVCYPYIVSGIEENKKWI